MLFMQKLFFFLLSVNGFILILSLIGTLRSRDPIKTKLDTAQELFTTSNFLQDRDLQDELETAHKDLNRAHEQIKLLSERLQTTQLDLQKVLRSNKKPGVSLVPLKNANEPKSPFKSLVSPKKKPAKFTRETNPFYMLGAYPTPDIALPYENGIEKTFYDKINYGLFNDNDYCEKVDYYNLANPKNIFEQKNFFTDFAKNTVVRHDVIPEIGKDVMKHISLFNKKQEDKRKYHLDTTITSFFVNMDGFAKMHEIGKHFLCATQMYNRIPGSRALVRKDDLVESVDRYAKKFESKPHCFNKQMFFPYSYRLYQKDECEVFMNKINSQEYKHSLASEPIQYLIKIGHGSHGGVGVFLLDRNETDKINKQYNHGVKCGEIKEPLIAQAYVSNPLLLDIDNKFDFRVYMFVASTNPLIVYYHDGVLRASLSPYNKFSDERGKHLTNSHVAAHIFEAAKTKKIYNMTSEELKDYHLWSFEELEEYLLESGKVTDVNWLDNHLRPQFRKAMIHITKMSSDFFWKQSNVYGLFGLDFMLDDNFNLWFIEGNPNPQLVSINSIFNDVLHSVVRGIFDIEYSLYRSRMKRTLKVIQKMQKENKETLDLDKWRAEYQEAIKNRFEPEYQVNENNAFVLILDESRPGAEAFMGNIEPECREP